MEKTSRVLGVQNDQFVSLQRYNTAMTLKTLNVVNVPSFPAAFVAFNHRHVQCWSRSRR